MINCPKCNNNYAFEETACPECQFTPEEIDGFKSWSPELSSQGGGYDPKAYEQLSQLESRNFWFRSRNKLIIWALNKFSPSMKSFLEVSCGTGFVLSGVNNHFSFTNLLGSEMNDFEQFDCIGAFDVIEHINEDELVLDNIFRALKPGGALLLTVPQHRWLWSAVDEHACHVRRYIRSELVGKVTQSGFMVEYVTSFVSLLITLMWLSRLRASNANYNSMDELQIPNWLNRLLEMVMCFELKLLKIGIKFPFGGSLLLLAKKGK